MKTIYVKKNLYTLEKPNWLEQSGLSKGIYHDRQHLGIILPANSELKIRQISESFTKKLTLRLLNDGGNTEKSIEFNKDWITISNPVASVPFIDTHFFDENLPEKPCIEYCYPDSASILPVYRKLDSEKEFLKNCQQQNTEFFLIDSKYFLMLIPQCDINSLVTVSETKGLDVLINTYEKVFTLYNDLAGLSFYPKNDTDQNIHNRYFIKADQNGVGAAYYGGNWAAQNSSSLSEFWLENLDDKWGHLHEIAHGYQGNFMSNTQFNIGEVWNNIYAATYQDIYLGNKVFEKGWLYANSSDLFNQVTKHLADNLAVNDWNLQEKLFFMMLMKDKAGNEAFTYFNKQYRNYSNDPDKKLFLEQSKHILFDMISDSYRKKAQIDVTPFITRVGGKLSKQQKMINYLSHGKAVYPLHELINQDKLPSIQSQLKLKTPFDLVDSLQLRSTGLTGNMQFNLAIDNLQQIYGEPLLLLEGNLVFLKTNILQPTIKLNNIPIGTYTLLLPTGKNKKYTADQQYAIVKEGDNKLDITYRNILSSPVKNKYFNFLGLFDGICAHLKVDYPKQKISFEVVKKDPHSYFSGKKYFSVTIKNSDGNILYSKEVPGDADDSKLGKDSIPFNIGNQLIIFHAEARPNVEAPRLPRLTVNGGKIIYNDQENIFTLTEYGLHNLSSDSSPHADLMNSIPEIAENINLNSQWKKYPYSPLRDDLYMAIQELPDPDKSLLLDQYHELLPNHNQLDQYIGNNFTIGLFGVNNCRFCQITINKNQRTITFEKLYEGMPHHYFKDTYAFVRYVDALGIEQYQHNFIGTQTETLEKTSFPLSYAGGERLFIHHQEGFERYKFNNLMQDKLIPPNQEQGEALFVTYRMTHNGIEDLSNDLIERLELPKTEVEFNTFMQAVTASTDDSIISCPLENLKITTTRQSQLTRSHYQINHDNSI